MWIDDKFVSLVSPRLDRFVRKSNSLWNFRCPICGDSEKNTRKARGYLLRHKNQLFFKCHNCSVALSFEAFLKHLDPLLYDEYRLEKFKEDRLIIQEVLLKPEAPKPPVLFKFSPLTKLVKISSLHPEHEAKKYIEARKIPSNFHYKIFFADNFQEWVNEFLPEKFPSAKKNEARIVVPMLTHDNKFFGCIGRAIEKDYTPRYYSIVINKDVPRLVGMESLDPTQHIYIVEGAFDSFFLPNAVAMCGPDLINVEFPKGSCTYIYDNQPRNKEVADRVEKVIIQDHKVFIWPSQIAHKDLNDCILAGMKDLKKMVDTNTFTGLEAHLHFRQWKK